MATITSYTKAALDALLAAKATSSHTHASTAITDFLEAVQDAVNTLLVAGSGVTKTYDDAAGTLTLAASSSGGSSFGTNSLPINGDTNVPCLPGRPVAGDGGTFQVLANMVVGTYFKMSEAADPYRLSISISTAATAGATARMWLASWNRTTRVASLVRDFGVVNIDSAAAEGIDVNFGGAAGDLPVGEYVICFVPTAAVTMRYKKVYDAPDGFQSGTAAWNTNNNRLFAMPYNQQGAFPSAAPATITLGVGTAILATNAYAIALPKFQ